MGDAVGNQQWCVVGGAQGGDLAGGGHAGSDVFGPVQLAVVGTEEGVELVGRAEGVGFQRGDFNADGQRQVEPVGQTPPGGVGEDPVLDEERGALRDHQRQGQRGGGVGAGALRFVHHGPPSGVGGSVGVGP